MAKRITPPDRDKRNLIDAQSEKIAELLGIDPEDIMCDFSYGVMLTPKQVEALLSLISALDRS